MAKSDSKRLSVALFMANLTSRGSYFWNIWMGIHDSARKMDITLYTIIGSSVLLSDVPEYNIHSKFYDLVTSESVDGIVLGGGIMPTLTVDQMRSYLDRFKPLPVTSVASILPEIPCAQVDNKTGMKEAIEHLVKVHGRRRIAFIKGPGDYGDTLQRFDAYKEVLAENGILFDANYIYTGNYRNESGALAVIHFLDTLHLQFDGLVASNDAMALGAIEELARRGVKIPEDVSVSGFDNTVEATCNQPPLTTVEQPVYTLGYKALELLVDIIRGNTKTENIIIPARMVIARTCGCFPRVVEQAGLKTGGPVAELKNGDIDEYINSVKTDLVNEIDRTVKENSGSEVRTESLLLRAEQLVDAFHIDLTGCKVSVSGNSGGNKNNFLEALDAALCEYVVNRGSVIAWEGAVSAIRNYIFPRLSGDMLIHADRLLDQAYVLIGDTAMRSQVYHRIKTEERTASILNVSQLLLTTFDLNTLMRHLEKELPSLGITSCYLSVYADENDIGTWARLILAYDEKGKIDLPENGLLFESREFIPRDMKPDTFKHYIVHPLYFHLHQLGFIVMEAGSRNSEIYAFIQTQISGAIEGAHLVEKVNRNMREIRDANDKINYLNEQLRDENLRMRSEMELAHEIQSSLLPSDMENIHPELEIAAVMKPCTEVGGDYYDVSKDKEGNLWIAIGDVSGHGLTPGLIMMMAQTVHTTITSISDSNPRDVINIISSVLHSIVSKRLHSPHYMTFTSLKYLESGRFEYAGAHLDLVVYRNKKRQCELIPTNGVWLNIEEDISKYTILSELSLDVDDILLLYTDGITECRDESNTLLGINGFIKLIGKTLSSAMAGNVTAIRDSLIADILAFSNDIVDDDISLVVVKRVK